MSKSKVHFVPAQPGLKLILVCAGSATDENEIPLLAEPLVAWRLSADEEIPTPVGTSGEHESVFAKAIEYPDGKIYGLENYDWTEEIQDREHIAESEWLEKRLKAYRRRQEWEKDRLREVAETTGSKT